MGFRDLGKKIKDSVRRNDLGIPAILLRSPLYSLCLNIIYLIFESVCVFFGFVPFARISNGGECVQYIGRYWGITILYPMTSSDEPHVNPGPIKAFSFYRFLIAVAVLAFIIFVILCIKNRHTKKLLVIIGAMAMVACGVILVKKAIKKWNDTPMELYRMQIITSDLHPGVVNAIEYPGRAMMLVPAGTDGNRYGYSETIKIENAIPVTEISRDQLNALLDAASAVLDNRTKNYQGDFAFKVEIVYTTRDGYGKLYFHGTDEFPEEWAEFARQVNEICGGDYLRENPEMVVYSDEWFRETYGIYESDLPEGASLQEMKEYNRVGMDMDRICGNGMSGFFIEFKAEKELNNYLQWLENNK